MRPLRLIRFLAAGLLALAAVPPVLAQGAPGGAPTAFPAMGAPANPKVEVAWNRFYDNAGLGDILRRLAAAHPDIAKLSSIGKSHDGRDIWCLEVSSRTGAAPEDKPAMWIDGNIHGNEVQAGEVVAYTAWFLCENYGRVPKITRLVDERTFYLAPSINPDGRDNWFHNIYQTHSPHTSRGGVIPTDNDRDGLFDEDGEDDLNGDGHIAQMRKRDPRGRYKAHPDYPGLMVPAERDEAGEFILLGWEGVDNDGDGEINEDGAGGYDPNRNWPWDWQPEYVQRGARDYPFQLPSAKAAGDFVLAHPNIAAGQSYHNFGGMILRGPGSPGANANAEDDALAKYIGKRGEEILPFYKSLQVATELYTTRGLELDWFYGSLGVICYTNELWTGANYRRQEEKGLFATGEETQRRFARDLLLDQPVLAWRPFEHPVYGQVEIGGYAKNFGRVPPSFLLEEECHRNMAFTLYHADQMPRLEWGPIEVSEAPGGLKRVRVEVRNTRIIPTRLARDIENKINRKDILSISPAGAVVAGGQFADRFDNAMEPAKHRPHRLEIERVPGMGSIWAEFFVQGDEPIEITYDSMKGGKLAWRALASLKFAETNIEKVSNTATSTSGDAEKIANPAPSIEPSSPVLPDAHQSEIAISAFAAAGESQFARAESLFLRERHADALVAIEFLDGRDAAVAALRQTAEAAALAKKFIDAGQYIEAQKALNNVQKPYKSSRPARQLRESLNWRRSREAMDQYAQGEEALEAEEYLRAKKHFERAEALAPGFEGPSGLAKDMAAKAGRLGNRAAMETITSE